MAVSIKSSNDCVYTTLAFSALHSILAAYSGGCEVASERIMGGWIYCDGALAFSALHSTLAAYSGRWEGLLGEYCVAPI